MGLRVEINNVGFQLNSLNSEMDRQINSAMDVITNIDTFKYERELNSTAFKSAKDFFELIHKTILKGICAYCIEMKNANQRYASSMGSYFGFMPIIDEDDLNEQIERIKKQIQQWESYFSNNLSNMYMTNILYQQQRDLEEKLNNLYDFNSETKGYYETADNILAQINIGVQYAQSIPFHAKSGIYDLSGVRNDWKGIINKEWEKTDTNTLIDIYQTMFGFDFQTAVLLCDVYSKMEKVYGEYAPQKFFAMMGGYNYAKGTEGGAGFKGTLWGIVADVAESISEIDQELQNLGFSVESIEILKQSVMDQYKYCQYTTIQECIDDKFNNHKKPPEERVTFDGLGADQINYLWAFDHYSNKSDFSHMCIIMATILKPEDAGKINGNLAGVYNGIFDIEKNAGYVGDIYGTAGVAPKMTPDDYTADLDAVNLAERIKENGYSGVNEVMVDYYSQVKKGEISREYEFVYNIGNKNIEEGFDTLYREYQTVKAKKFLNFNYNWSYSDDFLDKLEKGVELYESEQK